MRPTLDTSVAPRWRFAFFLLSLLALEPAGFAQWTNVGVGIEYRQLAIKMADGKTNNLFLARMAATNTDCIINSMIASNRVAGARERPSAMAARMEDALNYWGEEWGQRNDVIVAINGSFEVGGVAAGVIAGGDYYDGWCAKRFDDWSGQMGFVWKMDRSYYIGVCPHYVASEQTVTVGSATRTYEGINVARTNNQLILYTPQYNNNTLTDNSGVEVLVEMSRPLVYLSPPSTVTGTIRQVRVNQGATRIPFDHLVLSGAGSAATFLQNNAQVGAQIQITQRLRMYDGPAGSLCSVGDNRSFVKTYGLAQGNFNFLKNGAVVPTDNSGMIIRAPRTFVAYNSNYVFFGVCDGRSSGGSAGMTSDEMGDFCLTNLLATDGVNMDGGGSSVMIVNGAIKNKPSDGFERAVVNGLMMVNLKPKLLSTALTPGQTVKTTGPANFRLGPGTDYFSFQSLAGGTQGTVLAHPLNGVFAKGYYWWKCAVSGTDGWIAESLLAPVVNPPYFTLQPSNQIVAAGGTAAFTVAADGAGPLRYQWQKNTTNLVQGGHYSGVTNTTLTVSNVDAGDVAAYRCVVTNDYGATNSLSVTLSLAAPPGPPAAPVATAATGVTSSGFTANWLASPGAAGYRVDVATNAAFAGLVNGYGDVDTGGALSLCASDLNGDATYYYRVRAYNSNGVSPDSGTISVVLPSLTAYGCVVVSNADFEDGFSLAGGGYIANGWTEWEAVPGVTVGYDEPNLVLSGAHAQRIRISGVGTNTTAGGVYQRVPAIAGLAYAISVWAYAADAGAVCSLGVDPAGGTNPDQGAVWTSGNANSFWARQTWTGMAAADHLTIYLKVTVPEDTLKRNAYFDALTATDQHPRLRADWDGTVLTLTWPDCPSARLEYAPDLTLPPAWTAVTNLPVSLDGLNRVTLSPPASAGFFRLVLD
jgi:hypothetical protein